MPYELPACSDKLIGEERVAGGTKVELNNHGLASNVVASKGTTMNSQKGAISSLNSMGLAEICQV
jgi:hypothetical protein